jgi:hypothetical protein
VPLIESMTVRLLAGQNGQGGWTYSCPDIPDTEVRRLTAWLRQRSELVAGRELPRPPAAGKRSVRDLPEEIQQQLQLLNRQAAGTGRDHVDDNSNTQFATLALWVARRHALPTEQALARLDARFRAGQNADGGWGYKLHAGSPGLRGGRSNSTATMTAAGLLGLAVGHGAAGEAAARPEPAAKAPAKPARPVADATKDLVVRNGLLALGTAVGQPVGDRKARGQEPALQGGGRLYYFLWSLERVAVAYGLQTVGKKDWYTWGSEVLLANQQPDGSWQGAFGRGGADTCFALLFLKRANLAKDLTAALKGKVEDPSEVALKAGGVGGEALLAGRPRLAIDGDNDPPDEGLKPGPSPQPARDGDAEAARLGEELVQAAAGKQDQLLARLQEAKGGAYTQALAAAIPKLTGPVKAKAREALAGRLARMTAATLRDKLKDEDLEVRRATALACAMKEEREHVPRLIELLEDPEVPVARAAHAALKSLTNQDFGPAADASRADVKKAVAAWTAWWNRQGPK